MENAFANIDRTRLQALVPQVLDRLQQYAPLPKVGTVAGQAVASIFQELLDHPARGPVNDIDVFVDWRVPRPLRGRAELQGPSKSRPQAQKIGRHVSALDLLDGGSMKGLPIITSRSNLNILRTYRDGLINYTLVEPTGVGSESWSPTLAVSQNIVEGFDLNLVGVGINLQSHQVVATDEYLQFLRTSQLKVKTCNTPIHTLIRLASKITSGDITGVRCNFKHERAMLETAIYCQKQYMASVEKSAPSGCEFVGTFGSGKYLEMFKSCSPILPPLSKVDIPAQSSPTGESVPKVVLNTLVVPPPTNPSLKKLSEKLLSAGFSTILRSPALCADFPKLFNLFSQVNPSEQQSQRMEMFLDIHEGTYTDLKKQGIDPIRVEEALSDQDQKNVHKYSCAVSGRDIDGSLTIDNNVLDKFDSALFFFNQAYGATPELQKQALAAYESLEKSDSMTIWRLGLGADAAVSLATDAKSALKFMLQHNPVSLLSCYTQTQYGSVDDGWKAGRIMELLELGQSLDPKVRKHIAAQLLCIHSDGDAVTTSIPNELPPVAAALAMFPLHERRKLASDLINWICPQFPDMSELDQSERIGFVCAKMVFLGEPATRFCGVRQENLPALLSQLLDTVRLLDGSLWIKNGSKLPHIASDAIGYIPEGEIDFRGFLRSDKIQESVKQLLPSVNGDHLLANGARLLGMLASTLSPDDFISYLSSNPGISQQDIKKGLAMAQKRAGVSQNGFSSVNIFAASPVEGLSVWLKSDEADYLVSSLKKAGLLRHCGVEPSSQTSVVAKPKM